MPIIAEEDSDKDDSDGNDEVDDNDDLRIVLTPLAVVYIFVVLDVDDVIICFVLCSSCGLNFVKLTGSVSICGVDDTLNGSALPVNTLPFFD